MKTYRLKPWDIKVSDIKMKPSGYTQRLYEGIVSFLGEDHKFIYSPLSKGVYIEGVTFHSRYYVFYKKNLTRIKRKILFACKKSPDRIIKASLVKNRYRVIRPKITSCCTYGIIKNNIEEYTGVTIMNIKLPEIRFSQGFRFVYFYDRKTNKKTFTYFDEIGEIPIKDRPGDILDLISPNEEQIQKSINKAIEEFNLN